MAKNWYPVIDIATCLECGKCVAKCMQGVYDKNKSPVPVIVNPDNCVDHCHGCGNLCPVGSISYEGDDTGWIAPAFSDEKVAETGCGCLKTTTKKEREIKIEYLFLDLNTCDRCVGTDSVLDEVMVMLRPVLELAGYQVVYKKQEISNIQLAKEYRFLSSPTILVNGQDIFSTITESDCGCCGDIAGVQVDCRVFEYDGKTYEVPTKEILTDAILKTIYTPTSSCCDEYKIPENLVRFFDGKERKSEATCCCHNC